LSSPPGPRPPIRGSSNALPPRICAVAGRFAFRRGCHIATRTNRVVSSTGPTWPGPARSTTRPSLAPLTSPRPMHCAHCWRTPGDYVISPLNSKPSRSSRSEKTPSNPTP